MIEAGAYTHDLLDIKLVPGSQIDLEFIAQITVLTVGIDSNKHATDAAGGCA